MGNFFLDHVVVDYGFVHGRREEEVRAVGDGDVGYLGVVDWSEVVHHVADGFRGHFVSEFCVIPFDHAAIIVPGQEDLVFWATSNRADPVLMRIGISPEFLEVSHKFLGLGRRDWPGWFFFLGRRRLWGVRLGQILW